MTKKAKKEESILLWGFDLTDFPNVETFKEILQAVNLPLEGKKTAKGWFWQNNRLLLVTANNPITGDYYHGNYRDNEKAFASYMGIEGLPEDVHKLVELINDKADYIKGQDKGERNYI